MFDAMLSSFHKIVTLLYYNSTKGNHNRDDGLKICIDFNDFIYFSTP